MSVKKAWSLLDTKAKRRQQANQRYWARREQENLHREKLLKRADTYDTRIKRIYLEALGKVQKEIDSFYAKYAVDEGISIAEAKKRAQKLDIESYAIKAKEYVRTKDFSDQANAEMKLYNMTMKANRLELLRANIGIELVSMFDELEKFTNETLTEEALMEFRRLAGILADTTEGLDMQTMAHTIATGSFHNARFSDRIWLYQDILRMEIDKQLRVGMTQGKSPRVLAREIRKVFKTSRYNAERLMRTEMARVQTEAQKESYKRNGFERYEYICCGLPDACEVCRALDGKVFYVKDMIPADNAPPMHPNCHCSTAAYMDDKEYEEWLNSL